jgi:hypothetical protein
MIRRRVKVKKDALRAVLFVVANWITCPGSVRFVLKVRKWWPGTDKFVRNEFGPRSDPQGERQGRRESIERGSSIRYR